MKLTPELLLHAPSYINAIRDRELDLRGNKIPAIENLGVTKDQNDTIDITDNDIRVLGNFPLLPRLRRLLLANNRITRIDPQLAEYLPNVNTIVLTNNNISELSELEPLGGLKKLQYLSLLDNPVTRKKHYRSYVIWKVPSVRVLDFKRVRKVEREEAQKLFVTADGSESSLAKSISETAAKTFEPGEGIFPSTNKPNVPTHGTTTSEDQNKIREAIKNAKTLDEVARLEKLLQSDPYINEDAFVTK